MFVHAQSAADLLSHPGTVLRLIRQPCTPATYSLVVVTSVNSYGVPLAKATVELCTKCCGCRKVATNPGYRQQEGEYPARVVTWFICIQVDAW